jgi:hypothetical protein
MMQKQAKKDINGVRRNQLRHCTIVIFALLLVPQLKARSASPSSKFFGTYLNEGKILIEIDIVTRDGKEGVTIPLEPGHIEKTSIPPGMTKLYLSSRAGEKRRLLWSAPTPTPKSALSFFEKKTRMFYFRIIGNKILAVKPKDLTDVEKRKIKWYDEVLRRDAERR